MIGTVIDGSYRVDRLLGEGGFGVVYECTELELKRPVAIKMLRVDSKGERDFERFVAEGQNLASLNHPNVVQIYRLGTHLDRPYIVMELVRGRPLAQMIGGERPAMRRALEIMRQVAGGLAAIHGLGIVHRDLSPNNVVVTNGGVAKILDLGLSRSIHGLTSSVGVIAGTVSYMAPEQVLGGGTGFRAEIFSFGVMLYEVLTGSHPFRAEHPVSLLYNIAHRPVEPLPLHLSGCPEPLARLVARCLEKRPEDRVATMEEVMRCLDEVLALPVAETEASPTVPSPQAPRSTTRNPYLNRVMIKNHEDFFGRAQEVKRIYARLNATPPGSISIVGERKIGKSSLLNHVYARAQRHRYLEQAEKTVMVFLDLQQEKGMSMESFVGALLGIASFELRGRIDISSCALSLDGVKDLVERLQAAGFRLAIILDEFEAVTTNPNFNLEFFSFLRFLANHYDVSYITSSARDLQVLCHTKEISDSPFFNIFSTMRLSVFQRAEAEELIRIPSERIGKPLAPYAERIVRMAGLFPFFLQLACSHAIEHLDEHPDAREPDFDEISRRFYEEAKLHFRYIWEGFDDHERSTVLRVARGKGMPDALKHVLAELESRQYVASDGDRPRLFSSAFDEFVRAGQGGKPSILDRLLGRSGSGSRST